MTALNKQTLINLLIDSPLREAIKINLIDIVNNTRDEDLPKTYSTIQKELEIYQKATERRLRLAGEMKDKLGEGTPNTATPPEPSTPSISEPAPQPPAQEPPAPAPEPPPVTPEPPFPPLPPTTPEPPSAPDLPTPPPAPLTEPINPPALPPTPEPAEPISAPEPPLPPIPEDNSQPNPDADLDALKQIQAELDKLRNSAGVDAQAPAAPTYEAPASTPPPTPAPAF